MLTKKPGLPPAGYSHVFIGFAEGGHPFVLRWNPAAGCWMGLGFAVPEKGDGYRVLVPLAFLAREEMRDFIREHVAIDEPK